jgi:hypothetical protein
MNKINIFKLLKKYTETISINNEKKVKHFKSIYLKYNFFLLLKKFMMIKYRETKIVKNLTQNLKVKRKRLIKKYLNSMKKNYICEKFRKIKKLQKITKIFYAWKHLTF